MSEISRHHPETNPEIDQVALCEKVYRDICENGGEFSIEYITLNTSNKYARRDLIHGTQFLGNKNILRSGFNRLRNRILNEGPVEEIAQHIELIWISSMLHQDQIAGIRPGPYHTDKLFEHFELNNLLGGLNTLSEQDQQWFIKQLTEAYKQIDPEWLRILIAEFKKDLENPKVRYLQIRYKGKLIALTKIRGNYCGSNYVDPQFQGYGFGKILAEWLMKYQPASYGHVHLMNPNLAHQLNRHRVLGTAIHYDTDGDRTSGPLVKVTQEKIRTDPETSYQLNFLANKNNIQILAEALAEKFGQGFALVKCEINPDTEGKLLYKCWLEKINNSSPPETNWHF